MAAREVNFDGLIGPTHNYAGLAPGNLPSANNAGAVSSPRTAALQGLAKMRRVRDLGLTQGVLPPQERPDLHTLRALGFAGDDARVLETAANQAPALLAACWSASSMWSANAATVSPSADTADGRVHLTPANLVSNFHRSIEPATTTAALRAVFCDERRFAVHDALAAHTRFADEGAANHVRFAPAHGDPGVELFVFGFDPARPDLPAPARYASRQSHAACDAIIRRHRLDADRTVLAHQSPDAIDAGVFHNDVISTGNANVFLYHERSFTDTPGTLERLAHALAPTPLIAVGAGDDDFSLADAVSSYVFNSQVVTVPDGSMALILPTESAENAPVDAWVRRVVEDASNPIARAIHMDVRESMRNGGGPACLRLRVVLTDDELGGVNPGVLLTDELHEALTGWVERWYPESIRPDELRDHRLARRCLDGLDELTRVLGLGDIYPFQRR